MSGIDISNPLAEARPDEIRSDLTSIRRVWELAGPLRGRVTRGLVFRFAQSVSLGGALGVAIWITTGLAEGRTMDATWAAEVTGLMVLSLFGQCLFGYLASSDAWLSSFDLVGGLRLSVLDHLRRLPMGFHLSRHAGDTVTVLTQDMRMLETFMSDALGRVAQAFGLPLVALVFLIVKDPAIGLAASASAVLSVPVFMWSSRRLARHGLRRQDTQAEAGARMIEFVRGIAVIRAFNRLAHGEENFRAALDAFHAISVHLVVRLSTPMALFGAVVMSGVPLVLVVAGRRLADGSIDVGTVLTALIVIFAAYAPLLGLSAVMELTRMADASLARLDRILTAPPPAQPAAPKEPGGFDVAFDHVRFSYAPGTPVLTDVSFEAPERTMTAIVGPSGSGKSTILNLLPRFWDVAGGSIRVGGVDVREMSSERLNSLVTVVFQDVHLFAGTVFDNIALGKDGATRAEVEGAARAARAHDFVAALPKGYDTRVGEGGLGLSGGERQRVSIARALLKDAPIVLLDEATAAVDATNELAIQSALQSLTAGKTLIVVAHKLSTIMAADQILYLDGGRIVERGDHETLFRANGPYARLWSARDHAARWTIGRAGE